MDRRGFLKTTGAAAVAAGTAPAVSARAASGNAEAAQTKPAVLTGARRLAMVSASWCDLPGSGAERLARRIETAAGGRYRIEIVESGVDADLTYGGTKRYADLHPAFAFFSGLPFASGLDVPALQAWLVVGGGQILWDDLAAQYGFKPLVAGHTGASTGLWSSIRLEDPRDLRGARVQAEGLAADVLRARGATVASIPPAELKRALANGDLQAAEWLGPLAAVSPDLQPLAQRVYAPGLNQHGLLLSLAVRRGTWDEMSAADQAVFEACAAEEYRLSLAEAQGHALIVSLAAGPAKWPVRSDPLPPSLAGELQQTAHEIVESIGAADPAARRISDSYRAFRNLVMEPVSA
jgi:TRAP-type mannitol/chloroaromatic compound transport system substrate-binding protein